MMKRLNFRKELDNQLKLADIGYTSLKKDCKEYWTQVGSTSGNANDK